MVKKILLSIILFIFSINNIFAYTSYNLGSSGLYTGSEAVGLNFGEKFYYFGARSGATACGLATKYDLTLFDKSKTVKTHTCSANYGATGSWDSNYILGRFEYNNITYYLIFTYVMRGVGNSTKFISLVSENNIYIINSYNGGSEINLNISSYIPLNIALPYIKTDILGNVTTFSLDTFATSTFLTSFTTYNTKNIGYLTSSGNITQFVYFYNGAFYLIQNIITGTTVGTANGTTFDNDYFGGELDKLNFSLTKTNIKKFKFYSLDIDSTRYYWLTACASPYFGSGSGFNTTLIGTASLPGPTAVDGLYNTATGVYFDYVYSGSWIKTTDSIPFGTGSSDICKRYYGFDDFINGKPTSIYFVTDGGILYKYALTESEQNLITSNTPQGSEGSEGTQEFSGSGAYNETEIIEDIWNLDRDGDNSVSTIESVLAPITIGQNIINKLLGSLKDLWIFFKAILEIGNISFIPETYATHDATQILTKLGSGTTQIFNGEKEELTTISDLIIYIKYGFFFALFIIILALLFVPLIFKKQ